MICLIALVVFGVLGIFSATHRQFALEAFDCVFRRLTLRKCQTGFDEKMKMKITTKVMKRSPKASKFIFKHFEVISWLFTIILFVSLAYTAYGAYNLYVYGTCDPAQPDQCVFTPGANIEQLKAQCECGFSLEECSLEDFQNCGTDCSCLSTVCDQT
jgi:hypothetical protein